MDMNQKDFRELIEQSYTHSFWSQTRQRYLEMMAWWKTRNTYPALRLSIDDLQTLFPKTGSESITEYQNRLNRIKLFPLEYKFFSAQQRIYGENNVLRTYPEQSSDFWVDHEMKFDDKGDTVTNFFKEKVMLIKEVGGFGAVACDIRTDKNEKPLLDDKGRVKPYCYLANPIQVYNFDMAGGDLDWIILRYDMITRDQKNLILYKCMDRERTIQFESIDGGEFTITRNFPHKFDGVPAVLIRGASDPDSGFMIGRPRRYNLTPMYRAISELFYDLQEGSLFFGHPVPIMPSSILRARMGIKDDQAINVQFSSQEVIERVGKVVEVPDDMELPNNIFYQADMSGMNHLKDTIFQDLITVTFMMANVRYKVTRAHNTSGLSKEFDQIDEKGLLQDTAQDMEDIENKVFKLLASRRGEKWEEKWIHYPKQYDLSNAQEIFQELVQGMQYGAWNTTSYAYMLTEYLRKRSAPLSIQNTNKEECEINGIPMNSRDITALKGVVDNEFLALKSRPELLNDENRDKIMELMTEFRQELTEAQNTNPEGNEPLETPDDSNNPIEADTDEMATNAVS